MEEKTFIAITLPGESTPAIGTEHITNREDAIAWLEIHQEFIPNEEGSELEASSKYILLESHVPMA